MNGLIHCLQLDGKGAARDLDLSGAVELMDSTQPVWMHFDYSTPEVENWLREFEALPELVVEVLLSPETRPRVVSFNNGLLITLRGVNLNPGAEPDDMVAIRVWIEPGRIISTRARPLLTVGDIRDRLKNNLGPTSSGEFVVELCERLTDRMNDIIQQLEDEVVDLEERILEGNANAEFRRDIATLRRQAISLRRYLSPQREAFSRLATDNSGLILEEARLHMREISDRLIRYIEDMDAVRERAVVCQEEVMSVMSDQLNSRMYLLSIIAAIFLPLGFLTGLLGINVGGIPGSENGDAFYIFVGMLILIIGCQFVYFRWKRWF